MTPASGCQPLANCNVEYLACLAVHPALKAQEQVVYQLPTWNSTQQVSRHVSVETYCWFPKPA